jgi:uncharacterized protein (TIGR03083 family)
MTAPPGQPAPPTPSLPAGLRERVLAASLQTRPAGQPEPAVPVISAAEAFRRTVEALDHLLGQLSEDDWQRPALRDLTVQGLVGHLAGVEEDMQRCLAGDPAVAGADHVASTQPAADRQAGQPPAATRAEWRQAADRTLSLAEAATGLATTGLATTGPATTGPATTGPGGYVLHGLQLPLDAMLIVRAFEVWTHDADIRQAAGRPPAAPDPATLHLMTGLAAVGLPIGAGRTGLAERISVHLVLTGPGGGTWDVTIGAGSHDPAPVRVVADAVSFCRLVASRLAPGGLGADVSGQPGQVTGVLAAAAALALD